MATLKAVVSSNGMLSAASDGASRHQKLTWTQTSLILFSWSLSPNQVYDPSLMLAY